MQEAIGYLRVSSGVLDGGSTALGAGKAPLSVPGDQSPRMATGVMPASAGRATDYFFADSALDIEGHPPTST
jgi:hypothetical protein